MPELSDAVKQQMQAKAQSVRQRLAGGNVDYHRLIPLTGKNAAVAPGKELVGRCLPRWDYKQKFMKLADGKVGLNPKYAGGPIYCEAWEHWWETSDGKTTREWCLRSVGDEACPICEAAASLRASSEESDRKLSKRIEAKEVFLFNFVIGGTGRRALTEDGKPDIRVLPASGTIYVGITSIMLGGEDAEFARGDISDIKEGYDVKLSRPASQGDRWKVDAAPKATPLLTQAEFQAWSGWMDLLHDIPGVLEKETKSYDDLYTAFYGTPPEASGEPGPTPAPQTVGEQPAEDPGAWETGAATELAAATDPTLAAPDEDPFAGATPFDMPGQPPAKGPAPRPAPARRPVTPPRGGRR